MLGICLVCKSRTEVTEHHAKEMERRPDGKYQSVTLCDACHKLHEKYVNALMTLGYNPDKLKVSHVEFQSEKKDDLSKGVKL